MRDCRFQGIRCRPGTAYGASAPRVHRAVRATGGGGRGRGGWCSTQPGSSRNWPTARSVTGAGGFRATSPTAPCPAQAASRGAAASGNPAGCRSRVLRTFPARPGGPATAAPGYPPAPRGRFAPATGWRRGRGDTRPQAPTAASAPDRPASRNRPAGPPATGRSYLHCPRTAAILDPLPAMARRCAGLRPGAVPGFPSRGGPDHGGSLTPAAGSVRAPRRATARPTRNPPRPTCPFAGRPGAARSAVHDRDGRPHPLADNHDSCP